MKEQVWDNQSYAAFSAVSCPHLEYFFQLGWEIVSLILICLFRRHAKSNFKFFKFWGFDIKFLIHNGANYIRLGSNRSIFWVRYVLISYFLLFWLVNFTSLHYKLVLSTFIVLCLRWNQIDIVKFWFYHFSRASF